MSTINKVAEEALRQNMLLAQMSNASYNAVNGTRQKERDFREGILNMGKLDEQMEVSKDKITKEMIMDYKREQQEKSFDGKMYQQTGIKENLVPYVPINTGDRVDMEKQQNKYNILVERKAQIMENINAIDDEIININTEMIIVTMSPKFSSPGIAKLSADYKNKKKELTNKEAEKNALIPQLRAVEKQIERQEKRVNLVNKYIEENRTEEARINDLNKEAYKEYAEKFNVLNRDRLNIEQQPYETTAEYYRRIKDLESTAFDENIYKDKAAIAENRKFKKNLSEILKDPAKIENINKSFPNPEDVYRINNNWSRISNYLKTKYGINNRFTTEKEYIDEIQQALENIKSSTFNVSQITKNKPKAEGEVLIISNPADEKLYFRIYDNKVFFSRNMFSGYQRVLYSELPDLLRNFDADLFFGSDKYKKIFGNVNKATDTIKKIGEKIKISSVNPLSLTGAPPVVGTGIKRGRGMQQIQENEEVTHATEEIPKIVNFGNKQILLNKLYYRNVLSVKDKKGHSVEKLPNIVVSDDFVKIIMMLCDDKKPNIEVLTIKDRLEDSEKELLNLLLFVTGINKNKNIDIKKVDNVLKLKQRLTLVESQIRAGNDNPVVKKELKDIVNKLYLFGAISYNQANQYLKQF